MYTAAYPLHDGRYDKDGPNANLCERRVSEVHLNKRCLAVVYMLIIYRSCHLIQQKRGSSSVVKAQFILNAFH